jgi:hypothetical protein
MPALHLKPWTEERLTEASEHTGRKSGQSAGAYVLDLAALQKAILLCDGCVPKFDARRAGYINDPDLPLVSGACDGCKVTDRNRRLFVHYRNVPR